MVEKPFYDTFTSAIKNYIYIYMYRKKFYKILNFN